MTGRTEPPEDLLRRVLEAEAATVEVQPYALAEIRRRISARRGLRWLPRLTRGGAMLFAGTGAAALASVTAILIGVGSCAPPPAGDPIAGPPSGTAQPVEPDPTGPAGPTGTPPPAGTAQVPVYYLGLDRSRPRLYREFHPLPVGDGSPAAKARAAVTEMLDGRTAYDPDYASSWPAGAAVREVRIDGDVVVVDLSGAARNPVGSEYAGQAVQQLIWTATAATGLGKVRILLDGQRVTELWGHVDVRGDLRRAPLVDVAALVWLIDPQHGSTVPRTFDIRVAGVVFESTMYIRVRRGASTVVDRFVTLSGPSRQGEGRLTVTLDPGTYTVEAFERSAEDGSVQHLDNHSITVR